MCVCVAGVEYVVDCNTAARDVGVEQVPIAFQFRAESNDELFFIIRTVVSVCCVFTSCCVDLVLYLPGVVFILC